VTPVTVMKDLSDLAKIQGEKVIDLPPTPETKAIQEEEKEVEDKASAEIASIKKQIVDKKFEEANREVKATKKDSEDKEKAAEALK